MRPTLVVVAVAMVAGLLAGMPIFSSEAATGGGPEGIINMLGRTFAENRLVSLFILTLPAIALSEQFGLQVRAGLLIQRARAATVGRLLIAYQLFRVMVGALGVRFNGHAAFVRPLILPMSLGAASREVPVAGDMGERSEPKIDEQSESEKVERIKASDAAAENYGNFYGQNLSPVQPGLLLVYGVLTSIGYDVGLWRMVVFTTPVVATSIVFGAIQFLLLDRVLDRDGRKRRAS